MLHIDFHCSVLNNFHSSDHFQILLFSTSYIPNLHSSFMIPPSNPDLPASFLVIFDSKLSWRDHILSIKEKACHRLRLLQTLSHLSWGSDRKTLLHHHVTLILSTLDYSCHLYSCASTSPLSLLDPIHHCGLHLALGAFRSSPVKSLYVESGLPSLSRRRALLFLRNYACFHQFSLSKLAVLQPLLRFFSSSPCLPVPFLVHMDTWVSHSSFPHL
nr:uncharacterized protein LOC113829655 [Penaeus vannamei]